jgi:long-chain acyl-CoA synthetase
MSIAQVLHRAVQLYPERLATVFGDRRQSYRDLLDRVARLAGGLRGLGVAPGDRVGMLALNSDRYLEYYYAVPWSGGWLNPVNTRWAAAEMIYSFNDSGTTSVLIVDDRFVSHIARFRSECPSIRHFIYAGDDETPSGMISYDTLVSENTPAADVRAPIDEVYGVFYTGGTTGFPKGALLTHANFLATALSILAETASHGRQHCVWLHAAPMFHLADGWMVAAQTMNGATHAIIPAFEAGAALDAIATHRVTDTIIVPTMIQMLLDSPAFGAHDVSSLRGILYGASPISQALLERALASLPSVEFCQAYGATELGPTAFLKPTSHTLEAAASGVLRACGRPALGCEIRLVGADGNEVLRGEVGEITVRGPSVLSRGYWNKPAETAAALRDDWMHIGDAGYMDEQGFLYIVDRVNDMIVSGGENVYSSEVEQAVASHPAVAACAVIAVPSEEWGEAVHAVVVLRPGTEATEQEIREHCKKRIAGYKCPRSVEFRDALPLSGAGKVLKTELREPYWRSRTRRVG